MPSRQTWSLLKHPERSTKVYFLIFKKLLRIQMLIQFLLLQGHTCRIITLMGARVQLVVKPLPSMHRALGSVLHTSRKKSSLPMFVYSNKKTVKSWESQNTIQTCSFPSPRSFLTWQFKICGFHDPAPILTGLTWAPGVGDGTRQPGREFWSS